MERDVFERLAETHRPRAFRFAMGLLGRADLAEDLVQEALKRLFENRARYPLERLFGPYLVKVIARLCIDDSRSREAGRLRQGVLAARMEARPPAPDPAREAERSEIHARIARAMGQLPERDRVCLMMIACEGLSYEETAEALSLSFADVNNAVHRARLVLRERLGHLVKEGGTR